MGGVEGIFYPLSLPIMNIQNRVRSDPALAPTASGAGPLARGPTRGIDGAIPPLTFDILDVERASLPPP